MVMLQMIPPCYGERNSIMMCSWKLALLATYSRSYFFKRIQVSLSKRVGLFRKGFISTVTTAWCHLPMPTRFCQIAVLARIYLSWLWCWPCCCLWHSPMYMLENLLTGMNTNPVIAECYTKRIRSRSLLWADQRVLVLAMTPASCTVGSGVHPCVQTTVSCLFFIFW